MSRNGDSGNRPGISPLGVLVRGLSHTVGRLPWTAVQGLGRGLGRLAWPLVRRDRGRILEHLAIAFPEWPAERRTEVGRACLEHLATSGLELLHLLRRPQEAAGRRVEVVGFDHVSRLREESRPILVATGHCGNWELISTANASHGLDLVAMARQIDDPGLDRLVVDLRSHFGTRTVHRGDRRSALEIRAALRGRRPMAFLIDQDLRGGDCWVPFFGRPAHTPIVVGQLALRLEAAVVPTFAERLEDGTHRVTFHEPPELPDDATEITALLTRRIEEQVRRRPEQWVWMHRRWRRRPPEEERKPGDGWGDRT